MKQIFIRVEIREKIQTWMPDRQKNKINLGLQYFLSKLACLKLYEYTLVQNFFLYQEYLFVFVNLMG